MAAAKKQAPYGSWASPIGANLVASAAVGLGRIAADGPDLYWLETRPREKGRNVLVRLRPGHEPLDVLPEPYSARSRVNEYGGGAFTVRDGAVFFINDADQRLYKLEPNESPSPLTPPGPFRYADLTVDAERRRLLCIREDYSQPGREPMQALVGIPLDGSESIILSQGADFYSSPRLSPDGGHLAWIAWNHPCMPWDGSELHLVVLAGDGTMHEESIVAGGPGESVCQPLWSPAGVLHFLSDRTGWWNLYRLLDRQAEHLYAMEADFTEPPWVFDQANYAFLNATRILCAYTQGGVWHLGRLETTNGRWEPFETPLTMISGVQTAANCVVFLGGSPGLPTAVMRYEDKPARLEMIHNAGELSISDAYLSRPRHITFLGGHGQQIHAFYYAPLNHDFTGPDDELPPLIVLGHGGPTSAASTSLRLDLQFWTSRGFAVADVNYRGSSGYGREYRRALYGNWGVADVEDCVDTVLYLAGRGLADRGRPIIRGGSAGGFTALSALALYDVFTAGACRYAIGDLAALALDPVKFEAHYADSLIGPYPEMRDVYLQRSPINHTEDLNCPIIFFHGLDDKVVPPAQSETMASALRDKGLPVAYLAFPGEGHGFRQAETIKRTLEAELYFYGRVLGFVPADQLEPLEIANIKPSC